MSWLSGTSVIHRGVRWISLLTKCPTVSYFSFESSTVDQEHWWGLEWWSCEEQGRKLEQRKNFSSLHPQSALFCTINSHYSTFLLAGRGSEERRTTAHTTYFRHFLLLILIIYITLLLISSFQMIMTVIHWTVMTFFSLYCLKKLYDLLVISNIGSLTDFDLIPNAMSVCMQFQFKLFNFLFSFFQDFMFFEQTQGHDNDRF